MNGCMRRLTLGALALLLLSQGAFAADLVIIKPWTTVRARPQPTAPALCLAFGNDTLALVRRSSVAYELASSGLLDPATSLLLADAVRRAKDAGPAERDLAESDLTRALRAAFSQPGLRSELEELPLGARVPPSGGDFLLVDLSSDDPALASRVRHRLLEKWSIEVKDVSLRFPDPAPRLRLALAQLPRRWRGYHGA